MSKSAAGSLNTFSAASKIRSSWMCGCSMKRPRGPSTRHRPQQPKPAAHQIVRSAQLAMAPMKARYGSSPKWTRTTSPHGAKAAEARPKTARCSALPTIGPRVIDNDNRRKSGRQGRHAGMATRANKALHLTGRHDGFSRHHVPCSRPASERSRWAASPSIYEAK